MFYFLREWNLLYLKLFVTNSPFTTENKQTKSWHYMKFSVHSITCVSVYFLSSFPGDFLNKCSYQREKLYCSPTTRYHDELHAVCKYPGTHCNLSKFQHFLLISHFWWFRLTFHFIFLSKILGCIEILIFFCWFIFILLFACCHISYFSSI